MASSLPSGLNESASGCRSREFTCLGATGLADGLGEVEATGPGVPLGVGEAIGRPLLIGSSSAPWLDSAMAAMLPSGLIAMGPSSGPGLIGNGCSTPASAFSQYHAPVPAPRTAMRPESRGATPSVKKAGSAGGRVSALTGAPALVRSSASTSYEVQHP